MATSESILVSKFLFHLKKVRTEIEEKFSKARAVLKKREEELIARLQQLEFEYAESDGTSKQIEELVLSKDALTAALTGNANQDVLALSLANIDKKIQELHLKSYDNAMLRWDSTIFEKLSTLGDIVLNSDMKGDSRDYTKMEIPVATFGTHSKRLQSSPLDFTAPEGMAIDLATNCLYICDHGNNCVKVFDKSYQFVSVFGEKMSRPDGICIQQGKVYVTQSSSDILNVYSIEGKFLQTVGKQGGGNLEFGTPRGLSVSTEKKRIYIAEYGNDRVHCLNLDLTFHSIIDELLGARDVKLTPTEVVVMSLDNPCMSIYSYSHEVIRKMIPLRGVSHLQNPVKFALDNSSNILIPDFELHCVFVYSYQGQLIHKFGQEGRQKGEFVHPKGIVVTPLGQVIIISDNPKFCVQVF